MCIHWKVFLPNNAHKCYKAEDSMDILPLDPQFRNKKYQWKIKAVCFSLIWTEFIVFSISVGIFVLYSDKFCVLHNDAYIFFLIILHWFFAFMIIWMFIWQDDRSCHRTCENFITKYLISPSQSLYTAYIDCISVIKK